MQFPVKPSRLKKLWACFTHVANNVFKAKSDPFKKEGPKKEAEDKSSEKRTSAGMRLTK